MKQNLKEITRLPAPEPQPVVPILINLAVDQERWYRDYARRNSISRAEAIRQALGAFIGQESALVEAA